MNYIKIDNQNFKTIKTEDVVYNLPELKARKQGLQNDIDRIKEEIDGINALILEAKNIGIS
jgi:calcineurin-like phosphoesterase family protein